MTPVSDSQVHPHDYQETNRLLLSSLKNTAWLKKYSFNRSQSCQDEFAFPIKADSERLRQVSDRIVCFQVNPRLSSIPDMEYIIHSLESSQRELARRIIHFAMLRPRLSS